MNTMPPRKRAIKHPRPVPNLRYFRTTAGRTQVECAAHLNIPQPCISQAERYGIGISQANWYRLATFLGCDCQELQGYKALC